jgi:hypothetical protein
MDELHDYINELVNRFQNQPEEWLAQADAIDSDQLRQVPPGQLWSPHQVITHVMAADEFALLPRLTRILVEDQPELPNWDEETWMAENYDPSQPLDPALKTWRKNRQDLAEQLAALDMTGWNRTGLHPFHGERTLLWWLEYSVGHVRNHEEQLATILQSGQAGRE